jgi:DNA-binding transcriptional ArsR family regulator
MDARKSTESRRARSHAANPEPRVGLAARRAPWNARTGGRRVPWSELDQPARKRRYSQAVRGFQVGIGPQSPGTFTQYSAAQRELDKSTVQPLVREIRRRKRTALPPIFGSSARTEILALLAVNGPLTVRELARLRESDSSATFRAVSALSKCGLVLKRQRAGGRKYVSLHRAHQCARELRDLLTALDLGHPVARVTQARARWGLPAARGPQPLIVEKQMFGSAIRSQILVLLAIAGEADEQQIARALVVRHNSVWSALLPLTRCKLVVDRRIGARRVLSLSKGYTGAHEFQRLLRRLADVMPVYSAKATMIASLTRRWK